MPGTVREIHVGDVGTTYRLRVKDQDGDFDPSSATVKQLLFTMPGVEALVTRSASVETGAGDEVGQWFLTYSVIEADVDGSPAEFHIESGQITVQGYLEWADGQRLHSNARVTDDYGNELRVYRNLP
jgi:hypothetical protein